MLADVMERADVRVTQVGGRSRLALEPGAALRISSQLSQEDLDGGRAIEAGVAVFVDFARPTGPDGGVELLRAEAGARRNSRGESRRL
jgi:hypothetical protein